MLPFLGVDKIERRITMTFKTNERMKLQQIINAFAKAGYIINHVFGDFYITDPTNEITAKAIANFDSWNEVFELDKIYFINWSEVPLHHIIVRYDSEQQALYVSAFFDSEK